MGEGVGRALGRQALRALPRTAEEIMPALNATHLSGDVLGAVPPQRSIITIFDRVDGTLGHEGIVTHGLPDGSLMIQRPSGGMFMAQGAAAGNYFRGALRQANRAALRGVPRGELTLFACFGAESGSGQALANALNRDVRCFYGAVSTTRERYMRTVMNGLESAGGINRFCGHLTSIIRLQISWIGSLMKFQWRLGNGSEL